MNKKILIGLSLMLSAVGLVGCGQEAKTLTTSEKNEFIKSLIDYSENENISVVDLDNKINENIAHFSAKEKDDIIDIYVTNLFTFGEEMSNKLNLIGEELEMVVKEYSIDVNDPSTFKKIPKSNSMVKGFLEEMNSKGFDLKSEGLNSNYYITIDINEVLEKYKNHLSKSYKAYLEFNLYETTGKEYVDFENETIDLEEVVNRIVKLEEGLEIDKEQEYYFSDKWTSSLEYYYSVLFGLNHEFFMEDDKVNDEIISNYKELSEKHKGTLVANNIDSVIEILKSSNKAMNEEVQEEIGKVISTIYTEEIQKAINAKYPQEQTEEEEAVEYNTSSETETEIETETHVHTDECNH